MTGAKSYMEPQRRTLSINQPWKPKLKLNLSSQTNKHSSSNSPANPNPITKWLTSPSPQKSTPMHQK